MVNARSGKVRESKASRGGTRFELNVSAEVGKGYAARLRELLPLARGQVKGVLGEMSVILVGDEMMGQLHWNFMKIKESTDVMTFPIDLDAKGRAISGEVYVCVPYAQREAKERGVKAADEVLLYAVHGMLHLCGYDDRTGREFDKMHAKEDSILKAIGVGVVFGVEMRSGGEKRTMKVRRKNVNEASRSIVTRSASTAAKRGSSWR